MERIAIHMPTLNSRGGAERYAAALAQALQSWGHKVALTATEDVDFQTLGHYFSLDLDHVELIKLSDLSKFATLRPRRIAWRLRDAVWENNIKKWYPTIFINSLYKSELTISGIPHVTICHFPHWPTSTPAMNRRPGIKDALFSTLRRFPPAGSITIANSQFSARNILHRWHVESQVLYPPCPIFQQGPQKRMKTILSVGRFTEPQPHIPNKRLDFLIDAFATMTDLHDQGYRLVLLGSAKDKDLPYIEHLKQRADGLPIDFIINAPFEQLRHHYSTARIYWHAQGVDEDENIYPETQEHFGMSVVEAMSGGAVPIVIGTAGPNEIVSPIDSDLTWNTLEELKSKTRENLCMNEDELYRLRQQLRVRAEEFSQAAFERRARQIFTPIFQTSVKVD